MKFEKTDVWGFEHALRGMRNPLESWSKSDSFDCDDGDNAIDGAFCRSCPIEEKCLHIKNHFIIGKNDLELAQKLIKSGEPHRKFLRQIFVSVDITAPLYWWKEFDTYKVGTVANSTSTMHKLASTPITKECFEMDDFENVTYDEFETGVEFEGVKEIGGYEVDYAWQGTLDCLERLRQLHNKNIELSKNPNITDQERRRLIVIAKKYWKELIRLLPESWLQTRTITMNYENILNMITYRQNHKLTEWSESFINWTKSLPYAEELLFIK